MLPPQKRRQGEDLQAVHGAPQWQGWKNLNFHNHTPVRGVHYNMLTCLQNFE